MNDIKSLKIAITGASGWIGKNLIELLISKNSYKVFRKNVSLYGSTDKNLLIKDRGEILPIKNLSKLIDDSKKLQFDIVIHCAFFVRDYIEEVGTKKFIDINQQITKKVFSSIKNLKRPKLILLSSGAASAHKDISDKFDMEKDPYGFLKRQEEIIFNDFAETAIFRVYALSGKYMRNPERFALGNFIFQAKKKGFIKIESPMTKIRGYVNVNDLSNIILNLFLSEKNLSKFNIINAVSDEITLLNLAEIISNKFDSVPIIHNINNRLPIESYSFSPQSFRLLSKRLNYNLMDMTQQIEATMEFLNF